MDFPRLEGAAVACDLETTGLKWYRDEIFGVAVAIGDRSWYWDVRETPGVLNWLRGELHKVAVLTNYNLKFDANFMIAKGIRMPDRMVCTMVQAALIDEHLPSYSLDFVCKKYLGVSKVDDIYDKLAALFGGQPTRTAQMRNIHRAPSSLVAAYAKQDAILALRLYEWQEKEIKRQRLEKIVEFERKLLKTVIHMEQGGVRVDIERAERSIKELDDIIDREQRELNAMAGFEVNPNPSNSIKRLFSPRKNDDGEWVLIDGTICGSTASGAPSIDSACLRRMKHPAAAKILRLRKLMKCRDTFLKKHILEHAVGDRVYPNINQTRGDNDAGTVTGRLSITDPALQQIPARDKEIKSIVRPCFLPDEGQKWVGADWAQMDFRMFAHYTQVPSVLEAYRKDPTTDFHQLVADLTGLPRSPRFAGDPNAKQMNLAAVFGMGPGRLAMEMGLPYTIEKVEGRTFYKPGPEAEAVFRRYHEAVPGVREFLEAAQSVARSRGYVMSIMGRHLRFPNGIGAHKAGGYLFQSACAEAMKIKMMEFDKYCSDRGGRLLLTVHDELGLSMPEDCDINEIKRVFTTFDGVSTPIKFRVPIDADVGIGDNWYEAKG